MNYDEIRKMPIRYRKWFLNRLSKHFDKANKMYEKASNPSKTMDSDDQVNMQKYEEMLAKKFS
tara:strand:- start:111 stop:299 length:189 start_codon:yes stop_codon:yes gene_type:complete